MSLRFVALLMTAAMLPACSGSSFKGGSTSGQAPAGGISGDESSIGNSANGSDALGSPGQTVNATPSQVAALKEKCAKTPEASMKTTEQAITYPERKTCSWNANGNLDRLDKFVQASEISPATLNLPAGDICTINIDSPVDAKLHYDDFIILTIDNRIVFLSNKGLTKYLGAPDQGILTWDFKKVVGQKIDSFEAEPYCLGTGADCVLPAHDKEGAVALHLTPSEIAPIAASISGKASAAMNLTATGDNDDTDCFHTALDVKVKIKYIP